MLGRDLEALIQRARECKKEYGDSFVSVEHLVLGFTQDQRFGKQLFRDFQISHLSLKSAIESIRGRQSVIDQGNRNMCFCDLCSFYVSGHFFLSKVAHGLVLLATCLTFSVSEWGRGVWGVRRQTKMAIQVFELIEPGIWFKGRKDKFYDLFHVCYLAFCLPKCFIFVE